MPASTRRKPYKPVSTGKLVLVQPREAYLGAAIERHGPLPRDIAYPFWAHGNGAAISIFKERMKHLVHEKVGGGPFLTRPWQLNPDGPNPEPAWYDNAEAMRDLVARAGYHLAKPRTDYMPHRAMNACISASIELGAMRDGVPFISKEQILAHEKCPPETAKSATPLRIKLSKTDLTPDNLIGLKPETYRYYTIEGDRATMTPDAIEEKFDRYEEFFDRLLFKEVWGIRNLKVLFVTTEGERETQRQRIKTIMHRLRNKRHADKYLFKAVKGFSTQLWRAPRAPLWELWEEPWERPTGEPFDISKP
jgi:hypothetical protein